MHYDIQKSKSAALVTGTALLLAGCASVSLDGRHDLARDIAAGANMQPQTFNAPPFILSAFVKASAPGAPAHVYIEGDGLAWLSRSQPSLNPTPTDPIALRLAAKDSAPNVIYLARPCQYSGTANGERCDMKYWMGSRYAPEVLQSYNRALDELKRKYALSGLDLIGFSGGGTMAAILAGQRDDVRSLRSVAGNLDHIEHSRVHDVSSLGNSLNPPQYANKLARIPQYHFIGSEDDIVPKSIYDSYAAALPSQNCMGYHIVEGAGHNSGWVETWPELLRATPRCR